jgi:translation initiation factor 5A
MADGEEEFQSQDSGASDSYPIEAGQIRKGGLIMIKGNPCKVTEVTSSKTGKHGHAKCHFVAAHIFTGKKIEDLVPASHTTYAPFVKKTEYQCLDADDDGFVTCMDADGNTREDLKLPDKMQMPAPVRRAARLARTPRAIRPEAAGSRDPSGAAAVLPRCAAGVAPARPPPPLHALTLPGRTPQGANDLTRKIREMLTEEKDFYIIVVAACKVEQIMDIKIMTS